MTPGPWKARLFPRSVDKWHRVEREGAHETEPPIAIVKDPQDAIAFAALHDVREVLEEFAAGNGSPRLAQDALAALKGERR